MSAAPNLTSYLANHMLCRNVGGYSRTCQEEALGDSAHNPLCPILFITALALRTGQLAAATIEEAIADATSRPDRRLVWQYPNLSLLESKCKPGEPMTQGALTNVLVRMSQDAGILERITTHSIRRSAAKELNEIKIPLTGVGVSPNVAAALGHSNKALSTGVTEAYVGRQSVNLLHQKVVGADSAAPEDKVFDKVIAAPYPRRVFTADEVAAYEQNENVSHITALRRLRRDDVEAWYTKQADNPTILDTPVFDESKRKTITAPRHALGVATASEVNQQAGRLYDSHLATSHPPASRKRKIPLSDEYVTADDDEEPSDDDFELVDDFDPNELEQIMDVIAPDSVTNAKPPSIDEILDDATRAMPRLHVCAGNDDDDDEDDVEPDSFLGRIDPRLLDPYPATCVSSASQTPADTASQNLFVESTAVEDSQARKVTAAGPAYFGPEDTRGAAAWLTDSPSEFLNVLARVNLRTNRIYRKITKGGVPLTSPGHSINPPTNAKRLHCKHWRAGCQYRTNDREALINHEYKCSPESIGRIATAHDENKTLCNFECTDAECSQTFATRIERREHVASSHPYAPFPPQPCDRDCGTTTIWLSEAQLKRHMVSECTLRTSKPETPMVCPIPECRTKANLVDACKLRAHLRDTHHLTAKDAQRYVPTTKAVYTPDTFTAQLCPEPTCVRASDDSEMFTKHSTLAQHLRSTHKWSLDKVRLALGVEPDDVAAILPRPESDTNTAIAKPKKTMKDDPRPCPLAESTGCGAPAKGFTHYSQVHKHLAQKHGLSKTKAGLLFGWRTSIPKGFVFACPGTKPCKWKARNSFSSFREHLGRVHLYTPAEMTDYLVELVDAYEKNAEAGEETDDDQDS